jgi:hypothetical protein
MLAIAPRTGITYQHTKQMENTMENTMLIQLLTHLLATMSDEDAKKVVETAKPELLKAPPEGSIVVNQSDDWFDVIATLVDHPDRPDTEKISDVCSAFIDAGYVGAVGSTLDDDAIKHIIDNDDDIFESVVDHIIDRDVVIEWLQHNI